MLGIALQSTNPFFNIAAEEYLLKNFSDDIFMLYRNKSSVIIGKHQNAIAEVDISFAEIEDIKIVRRLSGGGSVYHDLGNINFTFIKNGKEGALVDFKGFTKPIIKFLAKLGVKAKFEGYNSLTVNGLKISGNAEHVFKNRVMHHGTLLFTTVLSCLEKVLYVNPDRFSDRAVKSRRANVTNISEHLSKELSIGDAIDNFYHFLMNEFQSARPFQFSTADIFEIEKLVNEKYSTWEWNFGYSPAYTFRRDVSTPSGNFSIEVKVNKGLITKIKILDDKFTKDFVGQIDNALTGCRHTFRDIQKALSTTTIEDEIRDEILKGLFSN